jgi:two-component system, OmpR family, response regulator
MMKVLVVEDEHRIAEAIKEGLVNESYAVDLAFDGEDGYNAASADEYDVIILDVMMPGMDGNEVCKKLRQDGDHTPIMMLTAKDQDNDIVRGLDSGADDYLAKPFSFEVLLARLRALLRRPKDSLGESLVVGSLELDPVTKRVKRDDKEIELSKKEYSILEYMMRHSGQLLSKNNIISHVWDFDADVLPNNVEVFINFLRNKIDRPFDKPLIHTVRGFGYRLQEDGEGGRKG